jgi:hypothetical protein
MNPTALLPLVATLCLSGAAPPGPAAPPRHPHFQKTLQCRLADGAELTLRYQTATFRREEAKELPAGAVWHLAGAALTTTTDLEIGGRAVAAGEWSLKTRKTGDGGWELLLDTDGRFSREVTAGALPLRTELRQGERFEHLCIDVQPTGDKDDTTVHLDVRFDTMHASALIRIPDDR